jgi:hypothetical protein
VMASVRGKGPSPRGIPLSAKTSNPVVRTVFVRGDGNVDAPRRGTNAGGHPAATSKAQSTSLSTTGDPPAG